MHSLFRHLCSRPLSSEIPVVTAMELHEISLICTDFASFPIQMKVQNNCSIWILFDWLPHSFISPEPDRIYFYREFGQNILDYGSHAIIMLSLSMFFELSAGISKSFHLPPGLCSIFTFVLFSFLFLQVYSIKFSNFFFNFVYAYKKKICFSLAYAFLTLK